MNTPRRILTINFGGIGDEVLFLPTLSAIRASYPTAKITLLVEPRSAGIGVITDLIDEVVTFDIKKRPLYGSDLIDVLTILRSGGYDMVVSSGSSPMVSALLFMSGIPRRIGYDSGKLGRLLLTEPMPLNRYQYAGKMYHDLILNLPGAASALPAIPHITAGTAEKEAMESVLARIWSAAGDASKCRNRDRQRVLIHPGTSQLALIKGLNKTWSSENWSKFAEALAKEPGVDVILAGGPDDKDAIAEITSLLKPGSKVISTYGQTKSLRDLVGLIDICDVIVCVDSAPMHIAVALGKPVVALFGPTDEAKLLPADNPKFIALRKEKLAANSAEQPATPSHPPKASYLYPGAPAVQLPVEIVVQSALDQLKLATSQDSSVAARGD